MRNPLTCRSLVEHHEVLVLDCLCKHLCEHHCIQLATHSLCQLQLEFRGEQVLVLEEVTEDWPYELSILAAWSSLYGSLGTAYDVCLCALELTLGDTVTAHSLNLGVECLHSSCIIAILEHDLCLNSLATLAKVTETKTATYERCVCRCSDCINALAEHTGDYSLNYINHKGRVGRPHLLWHSIASPHELNHRRACLGVSKHCNHRLRICRNRDYRLHGWGSRGRDRAECSLDLLLNLVNVNITYNNHRLHIGVIPFAVKVHETLGLEGLQLLLATDEGTARHLCIAEVVWQ